MAVEKELLKGIEWMNQGKEEGFNILYSYTYDYVYSRAKFIMKDEEDALDLTQETFIQAYKGIASLEDANHVYAWLGGIVYRQGMRIFRKKRDILVDEDAENIFTDIVNEDKDTCPEESMETKATAEIVMGFVNELPELQRSAVLAFYYDNMKLEDIARAFGCSVNTIKSRLNYAKKYLKAMVEEDEKKKRYKLRSFSPAILLLAFKYLFAKEEYMLTAAAAQGVYDGSCYAVGLVPTAISAGNAGTASISASVSEGNAAGSTAVGEGSGTAAGSPAAGEGSGTAAGGSTTGSGSGAATGGSTTGGGSGTAAGSSAAAKAAAAAGKAGLGAGAKAGILLAVAVAAGTAVYAGTRNAGEIAVHETVQEEAVSAAETEHGETEADIAAKEAAEGTEYEAENAAETAYTFSEEWVDDLYSLLITNDFEAAFQILESEELLEKAAPYVYEEFGQQGVYAGYKLMTQDEKMIGLVAFFAEDGTLNECSAFYSENEDSNYGFEYTAAGDHQIDWYVESDGSIVYCWLDGETLYYSDGTEPITLEEDEICYIWHI